MCKAECNLAYFRVGTSDWGTPRETATSKFVFWLQTTEWLFADWHATQF